MTSAVSHARRLRRLQALLLDAERRAPIASERRGSELYRRLWRSALGRLWLSRFRAPLKRRPHVGACAFPSWQLVCKRPTVSRHADAGASLFDLRHRGHWPLSDLSPGAGGGQAERHDARLHLDALAGAPAAEALPRPALLGLPARSRRMSTTWSRHDGPTDPRFWDWTNLDASAMCATAEDGTRRQHVHDASAR